jgi:glycosyltransferase involved in cell wall biosynthesis
MLLSAIVLTNNNQDTLKDCLKSLKFTDEIIVIDDGSLDNTRLIARSLGARVYQHALNNDWAQQRNYGLAKARGSWVLFVDSDEVVTSSLAEEIKKQISATNKAGFYIHRLDCFAGKTLNYGESGKIELLRLAKRGLGKWHRPVHETWKVNGPIGILKNHLEHIRPASLDKFLDRLNRYGNMDAKAHLVEGKVFSYHQVFLKPVGKFIYNYFWKQGFRDGYAGLFLAWLMSFYSLGLRIKIWENQK